MSIKCQRSLDGKWTLRGSWYSMQHTLAMEHNEGTSMYWSDGTASRHAVNSRGEGKQMGDAHSGACCVCVCVCAVLSHIWLFATPWTVTLRLLCPWGFFRQEFWGGLPCPPPGDLPNPGIKLRSPALQVNSLTSEPPGKPKNTGVGKLSLLQVLPNPGIKLGSPILQADSLPAEL